MEALAAFWTFPAIILAVMLIAWAVLAWVQTLPEFAVEAVIAFAAAKDPAKVHLITANFTGSLRLFVGLGWPMVYFVSLFFAGRRSGKRSSWAIKLDDEHAVAVLSLLPALVYFVVIYLKGTLAIIDGIVLAAVYFSYLYFLAKFPPHEKEEIEDLGRIPKRVMKLKYPLNIIWITLLFAAGAVIICFSAHAFLNSMLAIAVSIGISQFVFVQWVSPFLSEFPEKLSAFYWAKKVTGAPMALINFVSSSINQWTILVATIPFIYAFGLGRAEPIVFDHHQKVEILLTIIQSYLGFLFLANMEFRAFEAAALFFLWLAQFLCPDIRGGITWVYGAWALAGTFRMATDRNKRNAFRVFRELASTHLKVKR